MKHNILKGLFSLIFVAMVLPFKLVAQDYLTISFKDGSEERHLLSLVKEIATSKYNLSGDLCSDYVTQIISMADTILKYPLEDIEDVSFKGVDEDEFLTNVESVSTCLETILNSCESVSDIKSFLNDIESNPGVEKVLVYDNALVIRIKDWRNIVFFNSPKAGDMINESDIHRSLLSNNNYKRNKPQIYQSFRVAIADQNAKNEDHAYVKSTNVLKDIQKTFEDLGYDVEYIPQPDLKFFHQDIFDYDVVMLTTHGMFDGNTHWFATGEEIGDHGFFFGLSRETTLAWYRSQYDLEDADFCFIDEIRGGERRWVLYTTCSEDYIRKSPYNFNGKNSIIFTNVCESLNGNNSVAEMFVEKGASNYLGYKGTTFSGEYAGREFLCDWLLNGTSAEFAYNHLDSSYLIESDHSGAELKIFPDNNNSLFIVQTVTGPLSQVKDEPANDGKHNITVYGYTTMTSDIGVLMGFEFSSYSNMQNVQTVYVLDADKKAQTNNENGNYRFQHTIQGIPGSTCYYRAFTYDGLYPNYGETVKITVNEDAVAVDLGLPSGTKWADRNVGASKPEDYGGYYAWGEIKEKEVYNWSTYKWCNGSNDSQTKYCTKSSYGTVDNNTELDPEDDVAHVKWGGLWKMPTLDQVCELLDNCSSEWTTVNGINGRKFTSKINGNSIFLPAAGSCYDSGHSIPGSAGVYWSSSLHESTPYLARNLFFDSGYAGWGGSSRGYFGHSVRPVSE